MTQGQHVLSSMRISGNINVGDGDFVLVKGGLHSFAMIATFHGEDGEAAHGFVVVFVVFLVGFVCLRCWKRCVLSSVSVDVQ